MRLSDGAATPVDNSQTVFIGRTGTVAGPGIVWGVGVDVEEGEEAESAEDDDVGGKNDGDVVVVVVVVVGLAVAGVASLVAAIGGNGNNEGGGWLESRGGTCSTT